MPHINERIDFTAQAYIVHDNKVLLRKHDKHGFWLGPGGHVELHEDPNEAVIREAKEEVGLDIRLIDVPRPPSDDFNKSYKELIPPRFLNRHRINPTHEHVDSVYLATSDTAEVKEGEGEQKGSWKWFTREELDDPALGLPPTIKHYAIAALEAALGDRF